MTARATLKVKKSVVDTRQREKSWRKKKSLSSGKKENRHQLDNVVQSSLERVLFFWAKSTLSLGRWLIIYTE